MKQCTSKNNSLKQPELSNADCEIIETKILISSELINDCNFQSSMNENEMNFQYLSILKLNFWTSKLN